MNVLPFVRRRVCAHVFNDHPFCHFAQVMLPHCTESYADSADPPEARTPVCTLKRFPYRLAHTVAWARELFDECFGELPDAAEDLVAQAGSAAVEAEAEAEAAAEAGGELAVASTNASSDTPSDAPSDAVVAGAAAALARTLGEELGSAEAAAALSEAAAAVAPLEAAFGSASGSASGSALAAELADGALAWACERVLAGAVLCPVAALLRDHPPGAADPDTGGPFW